MFDIEKIIQEPNGPFSSAAICKNASRAEELRSGFIGPVRQISMFADLYREGNRLILEAPDRNTLLRLIDILNNAVEQF